MDTHDPSQGAARQVTTHQQMNGSYEVFRGGSKIGTVHPGARWVAIGRRGTWLGMFSTLDTAVDRLVLRDRAISRMRGLN